MDDYMFETNVKACRNVHEDTRYLEIFNYSDSSLNSIEEHPLTFDEFENFLSQKVSSGPLPIAIRDDAGPLTGRGFVLGRAVFSPKETKEGVKLLNGIRIVLQQKAKHSETFAHKVISFTASQYEKMVRTFRLPFRAIEGTAVVGPFFWCALDQDDDDPRLQIIFRKSDVRKKGKTRGWELMLSHELKTGMTLGYAKGTDSSDIVEAMRHLKACAAQVGHPMLLPVILLSHDLSGKNDQVQRDARDWLRRLEHAVSLRTEIDEDEGYGRNETFDLDQINRDLVECHGRTLWKRPQAYLEIVRQMHKAMATFRQKAPRDRFVKDMDKLHRSMESRLEFYRAKLKGIENYAFTTLARLDIQRSALYNIIAQKDTKLNLEMAGQQRRLAHSAKRDSQSMKSLSLLGALFLPATTLASIFSMTFSTSSPEAPTPTRRRPWWRPPCGSTSSSWCR